MASEGYNNVNAVIAVFDHYHRNSTITQMITSSKGHIQRTKAAYVYAPNDPRLREHACSLNSSVFIVETREDEQNTVLAQAGTKPNGGTFVPLRQM